MRLVKCKHCGNQIVKDNAYNNITYDNNLKAKNNYYCSQQEFDNVQLEKEKRKEIFSLITLIIGREITNTALNKELSKLGSVHTYHKACEFINENLMDLSVAMSKPFSNEYAEIRYLMSIIGNQLKDYEVPKAETEQIIYNVEDVIIRYKPKKKKKTISEHMEEYIDE